MPIKLQLTVVGSQQPIVVEPLPTMQPMVVDAPTIAHRDAFAERLRKALNDRFGAASESGWAAALKKVGITISQQGLHKWLSGDTLPAQARWNRLANALRVDVKWLRDGDDPTPKHSPDVRAEHPNTSTRSKSSIRTSEWSDVVAYAQHVAAGDGATPEEYAETDRLKFKATSLKKKGLFARKLAIFTARGDSMEPRILDGDALLFDQDDTAPRDGAIFVVNYEGDYLVKRLAQYGSQWFLTSDNAADPRWKKPRPIVIGDTCEIIGRVRWIGSWED